MSSASMGQPRRVEGRISTDRLLLRPIELGDADTLVELDSDPQVMRYLTGGRPSTRIEVEATIAARLGARWMAYERSDGAFVGWFGAVPFGDDEYELGYRLRRAAWGRGLATEGTLALIDETFGRFGARRVIAQTMAVNVRSRRVMERCGLHHVRTFHPHFDDPIEGSEHGEVEYELSSSTWRQHRGPHRLIL